MATPENASQLYLQQLFNQVNQEVDFTYGKPSYVVVRPKILPTRELEKEIRGAIQELELTQPRRFDDRDVKGLTLLMTMPTPDSRFVQRLCNTALDLDNQAYAHWKQRASWPAEVEHYAAQGLKNVINAIPGGGFVLFFLRCDPMRKLIKK